MSYEVKFIPEAAADYKQLDGSIKKQVNAKIDKLKENLKLTFIFCAV